MNAKTHQRRGLGRGLGALIPSAPRPEEARGPAEDAGEGPPDDRPDPQVGATDAGTPATGSADWIGVPLPGDPEPTAAALEAPEDTAPVDPTWFDSAPAPGSGVAPQDPAAPDSGDAPVSPAALDDPTSPDGDPTSPDSSVTSRDSSVAAPGSTVGTEPRHRGDVHDDVVGRPSARATDHPASTDDEAHDRHTDLPSGQSGLRAVSGAWFAELPVDDIAPNPRQPREVFDEDAMAELVQSITEVGLLQPVVVRPLAAGGYELVMGERRWRATRQAGMATIPAIVRDTADDDLLRDALLENLHRSELNALEEAAAYQQLLEDFGCTHDELAARIGRSRPQISNTIRLLKLSAPVQRRVAAGVLSAGHARTLLGVEDAAVQDRLAGRVVAEGISVRGLEEIVAVGDLGPARPTAARRRPTAPGVDDLAARLSDRLETRVKVDLGKRKGRITIEFASLPDLERIIGVIDPEHPTRTRQDTL